MFAIPRDSEAFRVLERMVNDPEVHTIRVSTNDNVRLGSDATPKICLKANQGMWTAPLTVEEAE